MPDVFIGLGSNLGDREAALTSALEAIRELPETRLIRSSSWMETDPVGGPPQGMFLNGVVQIETTLSPEQLLDHLQRIERELGRTEEKIRWGPRVIDLDLLTYSDLTLETPRLTLPHPRLHERSFVLVPLSHIAPDWCHPRLKKSASALLKALPLADHPSSA